MGLFKDMKFQLAIIGIIVAAIHFFMPDINEEALIEVVTALVAIVLGGHSVAQWRKKE